MNIPIPGQCFMCSVPSTSQKLSYINVSSKLPKYLSMQSVLLHCTAVVSGGVQGHVMLCGAVVCLMDKLKALSIRDEAWTNDLLGVEMHCIAR